MAWPPQKGAPPPQKPNPQGAAQLKQAMAMRSARQGMSAKMAGGPPGPKDERTESPFEKAREKRLNIP